MARVTLVISVYDKAKELELIFHALSIQSFRDFEVIVAEDGRNEKIKSIVEEWKSKNIFPLIHLEQDDIGFRKNKILNEAIRKSKTDYLIFIDGDCIPHTDFIKAHIENREDDTVLCGRRVNLTQNLSEKLNAEKILSRDFEKVKISDVVFSSLNRDKNDFNFNIEEAFIYKNNSLRKILTNRDEHILGCNFSIQKSLLEKINGFDENYVGPGLGEDSDIEFRLRLIDTKLKSVRNLAVLYHLYHGKTIEAVSNMTYFNKVKAEGNFYCLHGLTNPVKKSEFKNKPDKLR